MRIPNTWTRSLILLAFTLPAAATNLVTNGSFETTTAGGGQLGYNTNATGWTNANNNGTWGYNFLFTPGSADTTGVTGVSGNLKLYGPGNGYNNGLPASSPDGGNFIAADGVYETGAITQTIMGLTALQTYAVSFWYAGAQQSGFGCVQTPCTTEAWQVSLGSQTQTTATVNTGNGVGGFSGWVYTTMVFTATSSSEVLSFLAQGTPGGEPPFTLLDGVSLVATPEPGTLPLLAGAALIGVASFARNFLKKRK
jgi:hypothetical protein